MSKKSDQFEILISRIHELLEGDEVDVKWNERIPDPDNPSQGRQVDVLIEKDGLINMIECRIHEKPQDVKWIEELIGRRISLGANSIIAVSASGFTSGAKKKANKYGVILNDMNTLSEEEITSWKRFVELSVFYYRYEDFELSFFFDYKDIDKIDHDTIQEELQHYIGFNVLFKMQLELLDAQNLLLKENRDKPVNFKVNFGLEGFTLCNCKVKEVEAKGIAYLEEIKLNVPEVLAYGHPEYETAKRNIYVQNYNLGRTKVIHNDGHISLTLDLSKLEVPPYWQFRFMNIASEYENYMDLFEITNSESINMNVDKVKISIFGVCE